MCQSSTIFDVYVVFLGMFRTIWSTPATSRLVLFFLSFLLLSLYSFLPCLPHVELSSAAATSWRMCGQCPTVRGCQGRRGEGPAPLFSFSLHHLLYAWRLAAILPRILGSWLSVSRPWKPAKRSNRWCMWMFIPPMNLEKSQVLIYMSLIKPPSLGVRSLFPY